MTLLTILGAMLGAAIASFSGVIAYRVPRGESIVQPRSACGSCLTPIYWYDNIPILSWLMLHGRCRACHARISFGLLALEMAGAVVGAATIFAFVYPIR